MCTPAATPIETSTAPVLEERTRSSARTPPEAAKPLCSSHRGASARVTCADETHDTRLDRSVRHLRPLQAQPRENQRVASGMTHIDTWRGASNRGGTFEPSSLCTALVLVDVEATTPPTRAVAQVKIDGGGRTVVVDDTPALTVTAAGVGITTSTLQAPYLEPTTNTCARTSWGIPRDGRDRSVRPASRL